VTAETLIRLAREALYLAVLVSLPIIVAALVIGVVVGVLQAATQVQEPTVPFLPKLVVVLLALAAFSPWIGAQLLRFTRVVLEAIPQISA